LACCAGFFIWPRSPRISQMPKTPTKEKSAWVPEIRAIRELRGHKRIGKGQGPGAYLPVPGL
jgi:ribosomal protein S30